MGRPGTSQEMSFGLFWPKGGNPARSQQQTTHHPAVILAALWDTRYTLRGGDRFNFI